MEVKFYRCNECGNIVTKLNNSGVNVVCCGAEMQELQANVNDEAATEKHVPIIEQDGQTVTIKVGSVDHPMTKEHYIQWIYILTNQKEMIVRLLPDQEPKAVIKLAEGEDIIRVYEYCNLHSLWSAEG